MSPHGCKTILENIEKTGMVNGIDWELFKWENMTHYYAYPFLAYADCIQSNHAADTDIQYDETVLCVDEEDRMRQEETFWNGILDRAALCGIRGTSRICYVTPDEFINLSREEILTNIYFIRMIDSRIEISPPTTEWVNDTIKTISKSSQKGPIYMYTFCYYNYPKTYPIPENMKLMYTVSCPQSKFDMDIVQKLPRGGFL
jgi:hypothetical protein